MMKIIRFYPVKSAGECSHLEVHLYYHKGGFNPLTMKDDPRGYYHFVFPVKRGKDWIATVGVPGVYQCVQKAARYNHKQATKIKEQFNNELAGFIRCEFPQYEIDFTSYEEKQYA